MKMRQRLIAVLTASMIASCVPTVTFADTNNYVSTIRYAKEGTTYGYKNSGNQTVGSNGKIDYRYYGGFEFSPVTTYLQSGSLFMSLTKDTNFNLQAVLSYVDSFNAEGESNLCVEDGVVKNANTPKFNNQSVESILNEGVKLYIENGSSVGRPAKTELDYTQLKESIQDKVGQEKVLDVDKMLDYFRSSVLKEMKKQGIHKYSDLDVALEKNIVAEVAKKVYEEQDEKPITTGSMIQVTGEGLLQSEIETLLTEALAKQRKDLQTNSDAVITIKNVESFDVIDSDDRVYKSHLRVDLEGKFDKKVTYTIPLTALIGGEQVVILNVDGKDSFVTSGKYHLTQGEVVDERITVSADSEKIRTDEIDQIGKIRITETAIDALQGDGSVNRKIKLTLPSSSDLEFNLSKTTKALKAVPGRGFYGEADGTVDSGDLKVRYDYLDRRGENEYDRQTLIIELPSWTDDMAKGEIELTGIYVEPMDREAHAGDVHVKVEEYVESGRGSNLVKPTTLKVAEVIGYDVGLTCNKPATIKAGRSALINDKQVTFTLSEAVKDSLIDSRKIEFELENGYLFGPADIDPEASPGARFYESTSYKEKALKKFKKLIADGTIKFQEQAKGVDESSIRVTLDSEGRVIGFAAEYPNLSSNKADTLKITIPVATDVMAEGEVKLVAKNLDRYGSYDKKADLSCVVAQINEPIEVSFEGAKLKVGLQGQEAGSITIKETDKSMLERGWLFLSAENQKGITFDKVPTVTVKDESGKEIIVKNVKLSKDRKVLGLEITKTSLKASTIKIDDILLTADRTVPKAKYDLIMWGAALTDESELAMDELYHHQASDFYSVKDFIEMTTENTEDIEDDKTKPVTASFVIGEPKFTVNGEVVYMDSAAYIRSGYTFVPVKYLAQAFGIKGNAVQYDQATATVTIVAEGRVINMTNGKNYLVVNGTKLPMAVKAEIKAGRMCVPMSYIAAALDIQKSWDSAVKTATFTNVVK